jgi:hypothetical protein
MPAMSLEFLCTLLAQATPDTGPLSDLPTKYSFSDYVFSVLGNLLSNAIVALFLVTGLGLYYLQKKFERLQADKDTHVAYAVAQHRRKEQTLTDFTDGIPQNLSMVYEIFLKRSYLRRLAKFKPAEREPYLDGRTYKQISMAYERDVRTWLTQCQHFTSLCTQVRSRFDSPAIDGTVNRLREMFEALIELTPAIAVIRATLDSIEKTDTLAGSATDMLPEITAIREGLTKALEADPNLQFDRLSSNRTARLCATWIDKLFILCVDQMGLELRQLPVEGLKAKRRDLKQVERGMKLDQQAEQMTRQGESMHERKQRIGMIAWLAVGLVSSMSIIGCTNYGGSVPIDDDAGMSKQPPGSVDASVPIDDDAGLHKEHAPKP